MDFKMLLTMDFWRELLSNDFNRGYAAALVLVLGVILVLLFLRFLLFLIFRTRRCNAVTIPTNGGELVISRNALENAVTQVLNGFPALSVNRIKLYRRGKSYSLRIFCGLNGEGGIGLPELSEEIRPVLLGTLKHSFGVENLRDLRFVLEDFTPAPHSEVVIHPDDAAKIVADNQTANEAAKDNEIDSGF